VTAAARAAGQDAGAKVFRSDPFEAAERIDFFRMSLGDEHLETGVT